MGGWQCYLSASAHLISASIVCSLPKRGSGKIFPSFLPHLRLHRERDRKAALRGLPPPTKYIATMPMFQMQSEQHCNTMLLTAHITHMSEVLEKQSNTTLNRTRLASNILHCTVLYVQLYIYTNLPSKAPLGPKYTITPV